MGELSKSIEQAPWFTKTEPSLIVIGVKIAATVCFLAVTGSLLFKILQEDPCTARYIVRNSKVNNTRILLPDSSTVWLNANSTLEYTNEFGKTTREVTLKGEAFFDVKKNSKAFIVKTEKFRCM